MEKKGGSVGCVKKDSPLFRRFVTARDKQPRLRTSSLSPTRSPSNATQRCSRRLLRSRRAAAGRAELLAKSAHAGHLRLPAELLEVAENSGNSKGSEFGISEKCCILEKSRKNLVKFGENSAKFWQKLRNFGKKQQKIQQFLTKILRLESGAKDSIERNGAYSDSPQFK